MVLLFSKRLRKKLFIYSFSFFLSLKKKVIYILFCAETNIKWNVNRATRLIYKQATYSSYKLQATRYKLQILRTERFPGLKFPTRIFERLFTFPFENMGHFRRNFVIQKSFSKIFGQNNREFLGICFWILYHPYRSTTKFCS